MSYLYENFKTTTFCLSCHQSLIYVQFGDVCVSTMKLYSNWTTRWNVYKPNIHFHHLLNIFTVQAFVLGEINNMKNDMDVNFRGNKDMQV